MPIRERQEVLLCPGTGAEELRNGAFKSQLGPRHEGRGVTRDKESCLHSTLSWKKRYRGSKDRDMSSVPGVVVCGKPPWTVPSGA